jgi:hypothetical protein
MRKKLALIGAVLAAALSWIVVSATTSGATPVPTACSGLYSNASFTSITVPANTSCDISNSTVTGAVVVNKNASFKTCDSTIGGSLTATQAYVNIDNGTTIGGAVDLNQPGVAVSIGTAPCGITGGSSQYSSILCPSSIGGSVSVHGGPRNGLEVSIGECAMCPTLPTRCEAMSIGGSVSIVNNQLPVEIDNSYIAGSLICVNNSPAVVNIADTVHGATVGCIPTVFA